MAFPRIDGFVVFEKVGSGSYASVYKAYTKVGARNIVAIKCIDKSGIKHSGSAVDNLISEIRLLKTLTHPHIVKMIDFTWDDKNIYIITEYCCGGDLSKYIHKFGRISEKQVLYFLQQLVLALKFLREKGVVHMDLKPHNLLLQKSSEGKYILKVADFGFASQLESVSGRGPRGSPLYMAPEMLTGNYDDRVDLWSVGVIMYECLFGKAPYSSSSFKQLVHKIQTKEPIQIPANSNISEGCTELLQRLLQHDPEERITYEDLFNNVYLDLEHAPSKANYEKGVALLYAAVDDENAGRLQSAVSHYGDALLHLLPCLKAETDIMKRAALNDKLNRYMERAEQIKQYLKEQSNPDALCDRVPVPSAAAASTASTASTHDLRVPHASDCEDAGERASGKGAQEINLQCAEKKPETAANDICRIT